MNIKRRVFQALDSGRSLSDIIAEFTRDYGASEHYIRGIYGQYNRLPVCPHCGKHITQYQSTRTVSAVLWHYNCWESVYERCSGCSTESLRTDNRLSEIPHHGRYCSTCASERFTPCAECGEETWNDDLYRFNGTRVCNSCRRTMNPVHEYSYTPELAFKKEVWENTTYLGIELEVEPKDDENITSTAVDFNKFLKSIGSDKSLYLKEDGSIQGFEIVSHPTTWQAMKSVKWFEILKWLSGNDCSSHDNGNCGMHIHISKEGLTDKQMYRMRRFFTMNINPLKVLSNRHGKGERYCQFESLSQNSERQDGRYWALNTRSSQPTLEIRIFRGTLNHKRFIANLQLATAITEFCGEVKVIRTDCWKQFCIWLRQVNRFNHLEKLMRKEKLICA